MVWFTVGLLWWLWCALFRFFVIAWTSYGVYRFIKDKIDDKARDKYIKECQENHKKEMEEAKERISKMVKENKKVS